MSATAAPGADYCKPTPEPEAGKRAHYCKPAAPCKELRRTNVFVEKTKGVAEQTQRPGPALIAGEFPLVNGPCRRRGKTWRVRSPEPLTDLDERLFWVLVGLALESGSPLITVTRYRLMQALGAGIGGVQARAAEASLSRLTEAVGELTGTDGAPLPVPLLERCPGPDLTPRGRGRDPRPFRVQFSPVIWDAIVRTLRLDGGELTAVIATPDPLTRHLRLYLAARRQDPQAKVEHWEGTDNLRRGLGYAALDRDEFRARAVRILAEEQQAGRLQRATISETGVLHVVYAPMFATTNHTPRRSAPARRIRATVKTTPAPADERAAWLVDQGIRPAAAVELVRRYPERVENWRRWWQYQPKGHMHNAAGWLRRAIEQNYLPPVEWEERRPGQGRAGSFTPRPEGTRITLPVMPAPPAEEEDTLDELRAAIREQQQATQQRLVVQDVARDQADDQVRWRSLSPDEQQRALAAYLQRLQALPSIYARYRDRPALLIAECLAGILRGGGRNHRHD